MARTHRTHLAPGEHAKRGGNGVEKAKQRRILKSHKQLRPNDKTKLRKEYL